MDSRAMREASSYSGQRSLSCQQFLMEFQAELPHQDHRGFLKMGR